MMRIAKAYNPVIEIQQALDCVKEKGYCWWGDKVWHRIKRKKNKKIEKSKKPKVWTKDDLALKK